MVAPCLSENKCIRMEAFSVFDAVTTQVGIENFLSISILARVVTNQIRTRTFVAWLGLENRCNSTGTRKKISTRRGQPHRREEVRHVLVESVWHRKGNTHSSAKIFFFISIFLWYLSLFLWSLSLSLFLWSLSLSFSLVSLSLSLFLWSLSLFL